MMPTVAKPKLPVLHAASFGRLPWLVHGFSTRQGGMSRSYGGRSLNLGYTKDDSRETVDKNRRNFLLAVGATSKGKAWPLVALKQIHSDMIHTVNSEQCGQLVGDGLITDSSNIALAVQTADCFPILLVDTRNRAVGAFHAGWRGTIQRIVEKGLGAMRQQYGTAPENVHAAIGPGIQKCCYEVSEELRGQFESQFEYAAELFHELYAPDPIREKYPLLFLNARPPGHGEPSTKLYLDLQEANRRQLILAGVPDRQIYVLDDCTSCNGKNFFSHRAEKGTTGRMMAVVGIKKSW